MFQQVLTRLGIQAEHSGVFAGRWLDASGAPLVVSRNPANGQVLGAAHCASRGQYDACVDAALEAQRAWAALPAPQRGEIVRQIGERLRQVKQDLGLLVTLETGKILSEGEGEVQEMIDMCDFATGLSRQLSGITMASERQRHRMFEQWHPLGVVGVITAFNFPVAVWAWNAALALVCGNATIWKPSPTTPLTAIAVQHLIHDVLSAAAFPGLCGLCVDGDASVGKWMSLDERLPLVSATGSCHMGKEVARSVAGRFGRSLLELGGNNAAIVTPSADLDLALRAILFASVGTAGQRCTTLRRLIVHESLIERLVAQLRAAYQSVSIGMPWEEDVLMGPLINESAVGAMQGALRQACDEGGEVICGGEMLDQAGHFVRPALVRAPQPLPVMRKETFAPILYVVPYQTLEQALAMQNDVPQGLSSAIFTDRFSESERFLSAFGSDCGIANVNIGTSGAEIGGAFGGEKETGGGREAGSDAWKAYMRRQTCTLNWGGELPLAQGVKFDISVD